MLKTTRQIFKRPLARWLTISFGLLVLIAVSLAAASVWAVQFTDNTLVQVTERVETAALSTRIRSESLVLTDMVRRYTVNPTEQPSLRIQIVAQQDKLNRMLQQVIAATRNGDIDESIAIGQVRQYLLAFGPQADRVLAAFDAEGELGPNTARELAVLTENYQTPLHRAIQEFEQLEAKQVEAARMRSRRVVQTTVAVLTFVVGLVLVLSVGMTRQVVNRIISPLTVLHAGVESIRAGNLNTRLPITHRDDEIGRLAYALNTMSAELSRYQEHLEELVNERTAELAAANRQLSQEITERQQVEQSLRQAKEAAEAASRAKSAFLANMSHELRTPLNGILGYAQILKWDESVTESQRHGLDVIEQSGRHLLTLINDVLNLAKVEAGKLELVEQNVRLPYFLNGVVSISRMRAEQKGLRFNYRPDTNLPAAIRADETRLREILLNLLGNATKFTHTGQITFAVTQPERPADGRVTLQFSVEDTGPGIPPDRLAAIFHPFEQAGDARQRAAGTGLGLTISQDLLQLMGSKIQVDSRPGQGSRFWFDLTVPVADDVAEPAVTATNHRHVVRVLGDAPPRVLVIDDDAQNRMVFRGLLEPVGFEVAEAAGGREGLALVERLQPDVVVVDLKMPEVDGFAVISQLRGQKAFKNLVIVASSASVFPEDGDKSVQAGADVFLQKPVDAGKLLALLGNLLRLEYQFSRPPEFLPEPAGRTPFVSPPVEALEQLYQAARIGDIGELRRQLPEIAQMYPDSQSFIFYLQDLTDNFQINRIKQELAERLIPDART